MSTDQRGVSGTSATPKGNTPRVAWALLRIHESAISFDGVTQCRLPPTRDREYLDRAGFVVMLKPAIGRGAASGRVRR
jgi:hypothetical protein